MAQREEQDEALAEGSENIDRATITVSELPGRRFSLTMEVPLFLVMMAISLSATPLNNLILFRTCVHSLHHSREECSIFMSPTNSNDTQKLEEEVQKYATTIATVRVFIESVAPAFLSLFLGVWSDTHGRKPLIVWPLLGMIVTSMLTVLYSSWESLGPWWFVLTVVPFSLSGGFTVMFTGAFCYINDVSTTKSRSIRMTILEASVSIGSICGGLLSSYVLNLVGCVYLLLTVVVLYVIAYAFTDIFLRESLTGALPGGLTTVLDISLVKEMLRDCFKRRPNYERAHIILLTLTNGLQIFILYGVLGLDYMYVREKLQWALGQYTMYSSVNTLVSFVGAFIGVGFIQKVLPIGDLAFIMIALMSSIVEFIIKAFAVRTWYFYMGAGVSLFKGLTSPLIRSFMTKCLPIVDHAKVFALMSVCEGVASLVAPVTYNELYRVTIVTFPGAFYLLSVGICVVCLGFIIYLQVTRNRSTTSYRALEVST